jgi:hypothetical protein
MVWQVEYSPLGMQKALPRDHLSFLPPFASASPTLANSFCSPPAWLTPRLSSPLQDHLITILWGNCLLLTWPFTPASLDAYLQLQARPTQDALHDMMEASRPLGVLLQEGDSAIIKAGDFYSILMPTVAAGAYTPVFVVFDNHALPRLQEGFEAYVDSRIASSRRLPVDSEEGEYSAHSVESN